MRDFQETDVICNLFLWAYVMKNTELTYPRSHDIMSFRNIKNIVTNITREGESGVEATNIQLYRLSSSQKHFQQYDFASMSFT